MAAKLLAKNISLSEISELTGLSDSEISEIKI